MINVTDTRVFSLATQLLVEHANEVQNFKGRFVQIFLALKCFQNEIPSMWSGRYIGTSVLQTLLDDLFSKASRPATAGVWSFSTGEFLARTGLIGDGNTTAQNTWRNNLNLQKGIGCYATPQDLSSQTFLDQPRIQCQYLLPTSPRELAGATCSLCSSANPPRYRGENHRKWLKISPDGGGYATVDLRNIQNFAPYIAPGGKRVPLLPLLVVLYHDTFEGLPVSGRQEVDLDDFMTDFNLTDPELHAYFDLSSATPANAKILTEQPTGSLSVPQDVALGNGSTSSPSRRIVEPVVIPTHVAPPALNSGWDAERFVQQALEELGWRVTDVTRQKLGYDLLAERGSSRRYVEVKSSINLCRPIFTAREWQQARAHRKLYVVAILENFNPDNDNAIYWVPDPTTCMMRVAVTMEYALARSAWIPVAVEPDQI